MRNPRLRSWIAGLCALLLVLTCTGCDTAENAASTPENSAVSTESTADISADTSADTAADTAESTTTTDTAENTAANNTTGSTDATTSTTTNAATANSTASAAGGTTTTTVGGQNSGKPISIITNGNHRTSVTTRTVATTATTTTAATTATKSAKDSTTATKPATTTTTATQAPAEKKGETKISDYIPNANAWGFEGFPGQDDFTFELQFLGYAPYNKLLIESSMKTLGLGDTVSDFAKNVTTYEWASNHLIGNSALKNAGLANREAATNYILNWLTQQTNNAAHPWAAMESFTRWQHLTGEAGYDYLGCEIGATVNCYNLSIAFARGAAKQFSKTTDNGNVSAWFVDFSHWCMGGMVLYSGINPWGGNGAHHANDSCNENSGQSPNAARRAYYMSYMAGTNWIISECGAECAFYPDIDDNGCYQLSPHGEVCQEFYQFSQKHSDRGVTYTPFAIMLPRSHGLPYGHWKSTYMPFDVFSPNSGDTMICNLIQTIYTNNNYPKRSSNQSNEQCATPYGDTFDFLTQTADQEVMNSYPVILLAGDLQLSEMEKARIYNYVSQGGILVMNTVYAGQLSAFSGSQSFGKGRVISYGGNYDISQLDSILSELAAELLPVQVDGDIQYLVNIKDGSVVVTLINNSGVSKVNNSPIQYDYSQTQTITVTYTGGNRLLEVRDWITDSTLSTDTTQTLVLAPGEIEIIEFVA